MKFGVNAFIIARDTEREARDVLDEIVRHADVDAVNAFGHAVQQAGKAAPEGRECGPIRSSPISCSTTTASRPT